MGMTLLLLPLQTDRIAAIPVVLGQENLKKPKQKEKERERESEYTCEISLMHLNPGEFCEFLSFFLSFSLFGSFFLSSFLSLTLFLFTGRPDSHD